jgi:hypothetical protein
MGKGSYLYSVLTKKVLAALLCTGALSAWGGPAAKAAPTPAGYSEESIDGETWYVYRTDQSDDSIIKGQPGDRIQLGDGTTAVTILSSSVYGGYAEGNAAVSGSAVVIKPKVTTYYYYPFVYGGEADAGDATDNYVTLEGGTVWLAFGSYSRNGTASGGTVNADGGDFINATGSYSYYGNAKDGTVNIISGSIRGSAAGTSAEMKGDAQNGTVNVIGGTVNGGVEGSVSFAGTASGGTVNVMSGGTVKRDVIGSYSQAIGEATGGRVMVSGDVGDAYGSYSLSGVARDGEVTVSGGTVRNNAYGSHTYYNSEATGGRVTVSSGTVTGNVYGSYNKGSGLATGGSEPGGTAAGGTVTVSGGEVGSAYGTYSKGGTSTGGTVNVSGGTVKKDVFGSYAEATGEASDGRVTVSSGTVTDNAYGSYSKDSTATDGTVDISGGTVNESAIGAAGSGTVSGGLVNVSGGTVNKAAIGVMGTGIVSGGTVNIRGGTVNEAFGSYSDSDNVTGGIINLEGGSVTTRVSGGYTGASDKTATNNTVNLKASYADAEIYGGFDNGAGAADLVTGNTLNVQGKDLQVKKLANFETLNFYLPEGTVAGDTMVTINPAGGEALVIPSTGSAVNAYADGSVKLDVGDEVTLVSGKIDASSGGIIVEGTHDIGTLSSGVSKDYTIAYETQVRSAWDDYIKIKVTGATLKDQTKSLVETPAFTAAMVAGGADMLIGTTLPDIEYITKKGKKEWLVFAKTAYNDMRYQTGSHVDADGWNANIGFARRFEGKDRVTLFGPFFEYGRGDYDSYSQGIHADGDGHFTGGGLLAKQKYDSGAYWETTLRAGRVSADYKSDDLETVLGKTHVSYDYDAPYYAFHFGVGKVYDLKNNSSINVYMRYLYSRQRGFDATLSSGEHYDFDSVTSSKIRTGFRWTKATNEKNKFYAGLAYQYEFDNEATAHYDGLSTLSPSLQGSSGMAELGWRVTPGKSGNMAIDMAVTGWAGKQRGVNFRVGAQWNF